MNITSIVPIKQGTDHDGVAKIVDHTRSEFHKNLCGEEVVTVRHRNICVDGFAELQNSGVAKAVISVTASHYPLHLLSSGISRRS